jgi:hypothetical protein
MRYCGEVESETLERLWIPSGRRGKKILNADKGAKDALMRKVCGTHDPERGWLHLQEIALTQERPEDPNVHLERAKKELESQGSKKQVSNARLLHKPPFP